MRDDVVVLYMLVRYASPSRNMFLRCYETLLHSILHRWSYATRPCCIQFYIGGHMLRDLAAFNFT